MRVTAQLVTFLFHPIFILYYIFLCLHIISPVEFIFSDGKQSIALHLLVAGMSIFFPVVSLLAMRASGLISSISLENSQDRIGPMIAAIIFYVWLFLNYRQFGVGPDIFEANILGATISIALAFFINNFSKISLHTIGAGGLLGAISLFRILLPTSSYNWHLGEHVLNISPNLFLAGIIILAGLIGTSRLILNAHRAEEVYGGYLVGFLSQIVAYRLIEVF